MGNDGQIPRVFSHKIRLHNAHDRVPETHDRVSLQTPQILHDWEGTRPCAM